MIYGVTIQTLDRAAGNGLTMVFVDTADAPTAESVAARIARQRYHCEVIADHPVECPGFTPTIAVRTRPSGRNSVA